MERIEGGEHSSGSECTEETAPDHLGCVCMCHLLDGEHDAADWTTECTRNTSRTGSDENLAHLGGAFAEIGEERGLEMCDAAGNVD